MVKRKSSSVDEARSARPRRSADGASRPTDNTDLPTRPIAISSSNPSASPRARWSTAPSQNANTPIFDKNNNVDRLGRMFTSGSPNTPVFDGDWGTRGLCESPESYENNDSALQEMDVKEDVQEGQEAMKPGNESDDLYADLEPGPNENCQVCHSVEPGDKLIQLSCKNKICGYCLEGWIKTFLSESSDILDCWICGRDEHQHISMSIMNEFPRLFAAFAKKPTEARQAPKLRVYCYQCSGYIMPVNSTTSRATCLGCMVDTCKACKCKAHGESQCAFDDGIRLARELCKAEGYRECPNCEDLVGPANVCDDVQCNTCGCWFCFKCGKTWNAEMGCECADSESCAALDDSPDTVPFPTITISSDRMIYRNPEDALLSPEGSPEPSQKIYTRHDIPESVDHQVIQSE